MISVGWLGMAGCCWECYEKSGFERGHVRCMRNVELVFRVRLLLGKSVHRGKKGQVILYTEIGMRCGEAVRQPSHEHSLDL